MRRQNHLQQLQPKATEANYRAHKQNEREDCEGRAAGRSTNGDRVRERARESKAKKGFESGVLGLHGVPSQP